MKLPHPFYRLPLRFDSARLQLEAAGFADHEWQRHPTGFSGNSAVRLITAGGDENDDVSGPMQATSQLARCPYIRQILAHFGVVWSRSRLMRLAAGAGVPEHCDINYRWHHRVRIHIPVFTNPDVAFTCGGTTVNMAAGEAWIFDNWRTHRVRNAGDAERIHLVADTTGNARFWQIALRSQHSDFGRWPAAPPPVLAFDPAHRLDPVFERFNAPLVMNPAEVEILIGDLIDDLQPPARSQDGDNGAFVDLATSFCREWRSLWSEFGDTADGLAQFANLRDYVARELSALRSPRCRSNGTDAGHVFSARVLNAALGSPSLAPPANAASKFTGGTAGPARPSIPRLALPAPVFIVAAPRSGSTLLFETMVRATALVSVGGEAHGLAEGLPKLRPGAAGVDSNRLLATHVDEEVRRHVEYFLRDRLVNRDRQPADLRQPLRWIEKTPKNSLRIPFLDALFPDARFVFLWRDPRENIASIIEAWANGGWITYPSLPGWDGPWSLLLPPAWQGLRGQPTESVAAQQWAVTNRLILDDLALLPRQRWTHLSYAGFLDDPAAATRRLCDFAGIEFDAGLAAHLSTPLPLSAHTLSPPVAGKWQRHAAAITRVLPAIEPVWSRLNALDAD